jgi:hypothetical protein
MSKPLPLALLLALAQPLFAQPTPATSLHSPDGRVSVALRVDEAGTPRYSVSLGGRPVVLDSRLGLELRDAPPLVTGFEIERVDTSSADDTWEPVWGEVKRIRNHYNEAALTLRQPAAAGRRLIVRFRAFDDGVGFRYEFPEQKGLEHFVVVAEHTEYHLTGDHTAFWIPGDYDTNEYRYTTSKLSEVDALAKS